MGLHKPTLAIIEESKILLEEYQPRTLRSVYYGLVSKLIVTNNDKYYKKVANALVSARKLGMIPWTSIEDTTRTPHTVSTWNDLDDYKKTILNCYRTDVWKQQPQYVEVWIEKNTIVSILMPILKKYAVTLRVGRGYNSWASIYNAANTYNNIGKPITILYIGDFDASGCDMERAMRVGLADFGSRPEILKIALTESQVELYQLPTTVSKKKDPRRHEFVKKYGNVAYELDALSPTVLQELLEKEIFERLNINLFNQSLELDKIGKEELEKILC